ncbi:RING-H2 finger protein ATL73-like [Dioscorea cayenensis subsp. rotundata]|uniref:RING-H2 finger protein ATL73-like n=1 Tax=Dioscorea cayennensis subsp. rotundata TaxID=55577 RepID=A0AB40C2B3_DIOCR|nr:RING-H2 finger protein ATL73-like [Dioscorea cayenensis subsp. rotundata]
MASLDLLQTLAIHMYPRRLLLHPLYTLPTPPNSLALAPTVQRNSAGAQPGSSFDANVVMILAVLLCALICALGLNTIVRCALRCMDRVGLGADQAERVTRLAQSGLRRKVIRALPVFVFSEGLKISECCAICLSDFMNGERVRVLPKCMHGFHVKCIDRWLMARSSCPTCRQCLFHTRQKSSGCGDGQQGQQQTTHSVILPLEPEGLIVSYR